MEKNNNFYLERLFQTKGSRKCCLFLFLVTLLSLNYGYSIKSISSFATSSSEAQVTVSGNVTDDTGQPVPGASVYIKGTSNGTVTDFDGNYSLEANVGVTLVFSSVGFDTMEIEYTGQSSVDVILNTDVALLDEVLVIGYGTTKKSDLTGSVSSVKAEEISAFPVLDAVQGLQGRATGVNIQATNGEPGSASRVRIRGATSINSSSDPLFVVDGFVGGVLPPAEDIQSIEILKDASATAIYGSRGANGVVLVTTKKGRAGKMTVEINLSQSAQQETNRLDLLEAPDYIEYIQETNPAYVPGTANTDWQEEILRTGRISNSQLSISGGSEKISYYLSGTYFNQQGLIINSDFERFSINGNVNAEVSERLKVGASFFVRRTQRDGVSSQENSGGASNTSAVAGAFKFQPDEGIFDNNGVFTLSRVSDPYDNPFTSATERTIDDSQDLLQSNFSGEYQLTKNLSFKSTLGYSADNQRLGTYTPVTTVAGRNNNGVARVDTRRNTTWISENYLTYKKEWDNQNLEILGGYSYQYFRNEFFRADGRNFINDSGLFFNLGAASIFNSDSSLTESEIVSYYSRVQYSILDRYLFTFNARYDGSSTFSEGNKFGFFPSGAFAWNMKQEPFLQEVNAISQWKWRASYGRTGNRSVSAFGTLAQFSAAQTTISGNPANAVQPSGVANTDLSWELTDQFNVGLDIGLYNGRISLTADYYSQTTSDLLFALELPEYTGFPTQLRNIGEVSNKGFELGLTTSNFVGDFNWTTTFNFSRNRNLIESLPNEQDILIASAPGHMVGVGDTNILREGEAVGSFFGYTYEGVYQEGDDFIPGAGFEQAAGGERFADINGRDENGELTGVPDGVLDASDRTIIGDPNPDFIWGINNDFSYKGFDLNMFWQGTQGNDILSFTLMELDILRGINNSTTTALNRYTPTNTDTDIPVANQTRGFRSSSRFVRDGSYGRLKNLALGYSFPSDLLDRLSLSKLRLYISAQNLVTITKYDGYDPEVNYRSTGSNQDSNRNIGLDYASYPIAKTFTLGLNIAF